MVLDNDRIVDLDVACQRRRDRRRTDALLLDVVVSYFLRTYQWLGGVNVEGGSWVALGGRHAGCGGVRMHWVLQCALVNALLRDLLCDLFPVVKVRRNGGIPQACVPTHQSLGQKSAFAQDQPVCEVVKAAWLIRQLVVVAAQLNVHIIRKIAMLGRARVVPFRLGKLAIEFFSGFNVFQVFGWFGRKVLKMNVLLLRATTLKARRVCVAIVAVTVALAAVCHALPARSGRKEYFGSKGRPAQCQRNCQQREDGN